MGDVSCCDYFENPRLNKKVVSEEYVIQCIIELIQSCQSLPKLFKIVDDAIQFDEIYSLNVFSDVCLNSILNPFLTLANNLRTIIKLRNDVISLSEKDDQKIYETFQFALSDIIKDWYLRINKAEILGCKTLIELYSVSKGLFPMLQYMYKACSQWSVSKNGQGPEHLLDTFYMYLQRQLILQRAENSCDLLYVFHVFKKCTKNYTEIISQYAITGSLREDINNIQRHIPLKCIAVFYKEWQPLIVTCSRMQYLLRKNLQISDKAINLFVETKSSIIYNSYDEKLSLEKDRKRTFKVNSCIDVTFFENLCNSVSSGPPNVDLKLYELEKFDEYFLQFSNAGEHFRTIYNDTSTQFISYLWNQAKLEEHFFFIRDVFLFGSYEICDSFSRYYQSLKKAEGLEVFSRVSNLALRFPVAFQKFRVVRRRNSDQTLNIFTDLHCSWEVNSPLDEIISSSQKHVYFEIFKQNMLIRHILKRLCSHRWIRRLKDASGHSTRRLIRLRCLIITFCQSLVQFWYIQGVLSIYSKFLSKAKGTQNFKDLCESHETSCLYLSRLHFIDVSCKPVKNLLNVLSTKAIELDLDCEREIDEATLLEYETDVSNSLKLIRQYLMRMEIQLKDQKTDDLPRLFNEFVKVFLPPNY